MANNLKDVGTVEFGRWNECIKVVKVGHIKYQKLTLKRSTVTSRGKFTKDINDELSDHVCYIVFNV